MNQELLCFLFILRNKILELFLGEDASRALLSRYLLKCRLQSLYLIVYRLASRFVLGFLTTSKLYSSISR